MNLFCHTYIYTSLFVKGNSAVKIYVIFHLTKFVSFVEVISTLLFAVDLNQYIR